MTRRIRFNADVSPEVHTQHLYNKCAIYRERSMWDLAEYEVRSSVSHVAFDEFIRWLEKDASPQQDQAGVAILAREFGCSDLIRDLSLPSDLALLDDRLSQFSDPLKTVQAKLREFRDAPPTAEQRAKCERAIEAFPAAFTALDAFESAPSPRVPGAWLGPGLAGRPVWVRFADRPGILESLRAAAIPVAVTASRDPGAALTVDFGRHAVRLERCELSHEGSGRVELFGATADGGAEVALGGGDAPGGAVVVALDGTVALRAVFVRLAEPGTITAFELFGEVDVSGFVAE